MSDPKATIDEAALQRAAAKLRKLRLTDVGGRKEHPSATVASVVKSGLGGMYEPEAVDYILRAGIRYYQQKATDPDAATGCADDALPGTAT